MKYKRAFGQKKCVPKKRALKSVRKFSLAKNRVIEKVSALKSERSKKRALKKASAQKHKRFKTCLKMCLKTYLL